jgi:hypothetical protein
MMNIIPTESWPQFFEDFLCKAAHSRNRWIYFQQMLGQSSTCLLEKRTPILFSSPASSVDFRRYCHDLSVDAFHIQMTASYDGGESGQP